MSIDIKVADLEPESKGHNLVVQVVSVLPKAHTDQFNRGIDRVEVVLADDTGCITLNARQEQAELLEPNHPVVIRNVRVDIFHGYMRLRVDEFGKITTYPDDVESTPSPPTTINTTNDMSSVEYELRAVDDEDDK